MRRLLLTAAIETREKVAREWEGDGKWRSGHS